MKCCRFILITLLLSCLVHTEPKAQTVPVGIPVLEDFYRRSQLLGKVDSTLSFTCRPISVADTHGIFRFDKKRGVIQLLPVVTLFQYNTHHPYSLNDGAMIPAKGFQMLASAGVYAKYGPISIRFNPEFVFAENKPFPGFPTEHPDAVWKAYYGIYNTIDLPERFGEGPYKRAFWGQSSVKLNFGPASIGVSNENLWWGPGMRNSLLMTNTAPGFKHLTLNTNRPIKTPIGSFEGQLVVGRLDSSGFRPPILERNNLGNLWYKPKPNDWVYFNGIVLSYQPRWVPGLFLGAARSFEVYRGDMGTQVGDYLPVIVPLSKKSVGGQDENNKKRNQLASLFIRWVWFKENAEVYFEYGREDHAWDLRDFFLQPEHSRGYVFGLRKLIPLTHKTNQYIQIALEITQLETAKNEGNRSPGFWYVHSQVRQGYTQSGQLLGSGIGPGSNMQTLSFSWVKSMKMIGVQMERYTHNNDFQYLVIKDIRSNWVDLATSLIGEWDFRNLLIKAKIDAIVSFNYEHLFVAVPVGTPDFWVPGKNTWNFQGQVGLGYRF